MPLKESPTHSPPDSFSGTATVPLDPERVVALKGALQANDISGLPAFWPDNLDPLDNQKVSQWLLGEGQWEGEEPAWCHYRLDFSDATIRPGTWRWRTKRLLDTIIVVLGLPIILPVLALAAVGVFLTIGRPVHFRQRRPGYLGKPFKMYKLRTMVLDGDSESPREEMERTTLLGRFLRKSSIDELPQILNVFKGEMSLVGPRPQLISYLPRFEPRQLLRHRVLPGITGLAQVKGRNELEWDRRLSLDLTYAEESSMWLDIRILGLTLVRVLGRKGAVAQKGAPNPELMGQEHGLGT